MKGVGGVVWYGMPKDFRHSTKPSSAFIAALRHSGLSVVRTKIGNMRILHAFLQVNLQFLLLSTFSLLVSDNEELFANHQE